MNDGQHAQARQLLEETLAQRGDDSQLRLALAVCLILLSEHLEAEKELRSLLGEEPQNASIWYHLGVALHAQSRLGEAAHAYRQALLIDDSHADARERLAQCEGAVRETLRPRWRHFAPPAVVATLFTAGVIVTGQAGTLVSPLHVLLPLGLIAFCLYAWTAVALQARRNSYVLYERRLGLHVGVLDRQTLSIWLFEITGARAVRGPLSALTQTASVEVDYGHDLKALLEGVGNSAEADRVAKLLTPQATR